MPDIKSICTELLRLDAEENASASMYYSQTYELFCRDNAPAIARRCLELEAENERLKAYEKAAIKWLPGMMPELKGAKTDV